MVWLNSTPYRANGRFDARLILERPADFLWISMLMADLVETAIAETLAAAPRLIATSLRASPFAATVSRLLTTGCDLEIVDHMGPSHSILEEYPVAHTARPASYVYIGDFLIGGTEMKRCEIYAHCRGGRLVAAVVIGSLFEPAHDNRTPDEAAGHPYPSNMTILKLAELSQRMVVETGLARR
jgi:hypothetical protein